MRSLVSLFVLVLTCTACADPMNFKFVTSGQNPDDAPIISRTIQGLTLKPATPSDAKIFRDAQNNALVEWKRRGRINYHWRDRAGVPVSEESEYYEIEVYNGANVANTYRVPLTIAQPVQWNKFYRSDLFTVTADGKGSIYRFNDFIGDVTAAGSRQLINGDFVFEFESYHDGSLLYYFPDVLIAPANDAASGTTIGGFFGGTNWTGFPFISNSGGLVPTVAAGDRFVIAYQSGVVKYFKNPTSDQSPVLFQQSAPATYFPYWIRAACASPGASGFGIKNPSLLRFDTPDWTYTADMQTADGLTPGSSIHLKIYQVSAVAGRGLPLDVTL